MPDQKFDFLIEYIQELLKKLDLGDMTKEEIPVIEADEPASEESFSSYESDKETKETFTESDDKGEIEVKDIPF